LLFHHDKFVLYYRDFLYTQKKWNGNGTLETVLPLDGIESEQWFDE
jgi:hypothetical protein